MVFIKAPEADVAFSGPVTDQDRTLEFGWA